MSDTIVWGLLGVVVAFGLVGVALLVGRFIWAQVEPGDPDPGGREAPPPRGGRWMKDPEPPDNTAVDLLRILRGGRR